MVVVMFVYAMLEQYYVVLCLSVCLSVRHKQWCIAKNGGGYTQRGVVKGLKVPYLFMITEVSIRCQKNPGGWYTPYTRVYPPNTPLVTSRCSTKMLNTGLSKQSRPAQETLFFDAKDLGEIRIR